ncbi:hypothetical protein E2C01_026988 [Portunus trituberculatus]|uniref:Uncharacterized protein n=1 Tax=Portunus trituberculatus TaxID=210409 RepID=A0A5B7EKR9_PORTR|nr:hypothetical protein [Portunus trituberculatus]
MKSPALCLFDLKCLSLPSVTYIRGGFGDLIFRHLMTALSQSVSHLSHSPRRLFRKNWCYEVLGAAASLTGPAGGEARRAEAQD